MKPLLALIAVTMGIIFAVPAHSEPGIDEDQAVVGLQQQYMTHALGSEDRVHGPAVEVVNLHCWATSASTSPRPICVTRLAESK